MYCRLVPYSVKIEKLYIFIPIGMLFCNQQQAYYLLQTTADQ